MDISKNKFYNFNNIINYALFQKKLIKLFFYIKLLKKILMGWKIINKNKNISIP